MSAPGYWMQETSGVLRPAVEAYLAGGAMTPEQVAALRAYLRQWVDAPVWLGSNGLDELRRTTDGLNSREAISAWLTIAVDEGIEPL